LKDLQGLSSELDSVIKKLKYVSLSSDASYDAPVNKQNLNKLRDETVKALTSFKNILINHLSK